MKDNIQVVHKETGEKDDEITKLREKIAELKQERTDKEEE
jgi:hypothetical protein